MLAHQQPPAERRLSFLELELLETVEADQVVASLTDYADLPAAIIGNVVIGVIDRAVNLSEQHLRDLGAAAQRGIAAHTTWPEEQRHYQRVLGHVESRLEQLGGGRES